MASRLRSVKFAGLPSNNKAGKSRQHENQNGYLSAVMMLQLDFTDLKERLGVCVLRDVFHDFLCVWSEARLKRLNRVKEEMSSCMYGAGDPGCSPEIPCSTETRFNADPSSRRTIGMC
jgi:hypothetical protein